MVLLSTQKQALPMKVAGARPWGWSIPLPPGQAPTSFPQAQYPGSVWVSAVSHCKSSPVWTWFLLSAVFPVKTVTAAIPSVYSMTAPKRYQEIAIRMQQWRRLFLQLREGRTLCFARGCKNRTRRRTQQQSRRSSTLEMLLGEQLFLPPPVRTASQTVRGPAVESWGGSRAIRLHVLGLILEGQSADACFTPAWNWSGLVGGADCEFSTAITKRMTRLL